MGSPEPPKTYSPAESAQAASTAQLAGQMFEGANKPILGYSDVFTRTQLDPILSQMQSGLSNRAALRGAQAQRDIQSQVDPMAFQQREARLDAANQRLAQVLGVPLEDYSYVAPESAYAVPTAEDLPDLRDVGTRAHDITKYLSNISINKSGKVKIEKPKALRGKKKDDRAGETLDLGRLGSGLGAINF
jgi:hypothetical protein